MVTEGVECVLLDIEGTVCPISFVKDTLFPYAIKALRDVLAAQWDSQAFSPYREAFPEEHRQSPEALQQHVEDLTKRDVKIAYLKNLQGYLWNDGYESGVYSTDLFRDVTPQLQRWSTDGLSLAIYSSGSVFAQKLLFGHVRPNDAVGTKKRGRGDGETDGAALQEPPNKKIQPAAEVRDVDQNEAAIDGVIPVAEPTAGPDSATATGISTEPKKTNDIGKSDFKTEDLTGLFTGWFDTTNAGLKTEAGSYTRIAEELKHNPGAILFLSDNVKEVDAAIQAGMKSILVDRPGNATVSESDRARLDVVESLSEIELSTPRQEERK